MDEYTIDQIVKASLKNDQVFDAFENRLNMAVPRSEASVRDAVRFSQELYAISNVLGYFEEIKGRQQDIARKEYALRSGISYLRKSSPLLKKDGRF